MAAPFRFISEQDVARGLGEADSFRLVRRGFLDLGSGRAKMPPKIYLDVPAGDFRAMPVYSSRGGGFVGFKWVSVFPKNPQRGLPSVLGTLLLNDARTGLLLAVLEANTLTALRTAAAAALASSRLAARKRVLAIVGAGAQAVYQLRAHFSKFDLKDVRIWSPLPAEGEKFARRRRFGPRRLCRGTPREAMVSLAAARGSCRVRFEPNLRLCVKDADMICTCTPSRRPLIKAAWISPGAHINAIGADAPGKQELEGRLLKRASVFVDDRAQAVHSGEINVPISRGEFRPRDIAGTLTDVLRGRCGRKKPEEITIFDSTGLAIQDIALAIHLYRKISRR